MLESLPGCVDITSTCEIVDCPKATDTERTLSRSHTIVALFVPIEKPIAPKPLLDAIEGGAHTSMIGPLVTEATHQQKRSVKPVSV